MIIYNKLGDYLKSKDMKYIDLQREIGLSPTIVAKFQKNRSVTIDTVDKVCTYLKCQPGDIMEWVEDENEAEKKQIEQQIADLQAKLKTM